MDQAHQPARTLDVYRATEMGEWVLNCESWCKLLVNRVYLGEAVRKGKSCPGEHAAGGSSGAGVQLEKTHS
jgi:hypothetical protein